MRLRTSVSTLLAAATLPLALVACSSGAAKTATSAAGPAQAASAASSGAASASPSSAPSSADPDANLLTGNQLKALLAPASSFPAGYAVDSANSRDTGAMYVAPAVADVPTPDCTKLGGTSWTGITGITGVSFAENGYVNKDTSSETDQEIDVYRGTTAQTVMGALGKISAACPSYTDSQTNGKVKVSEKATPGLGDGAYTITLTSDAWQGGTTLVAARVGTAVVTVLASSASDSGAPAATRLAGQLATALKGKA